MKLIEAMKRIKELAAKAEDLRAKIATHCAHLDIETSPYGDKTKAQVDSWLQARTDVLAEILRLRVAIQRTNLLTPVAINVNGGETGFVTHSIAEWIHRRRDLAALQMAGWQALTDRGLKEGEIKSSVGAEPRLVKIVRHYDARARDGMIELLRAEPSRIDATLEVVNATTDLIEA